ncbi:MAG: NosD domain-containing protein [Nitrososphaerota archaeon]|nr:right-handed parallel beta-helix repeat-containing protein [Candidatus Bathyarchaeota archaeon]MDW8194484.1 NosD domain-containing protein [Nitrososphaerota archaeon]
MALIGCKGITVKNLDLGGNVEGVFLGSTTNSTIINNGISKCLFGVNIDSSLNNTIRGNIIIGNENGIHLSWSSSNNIIQGNYIKANTAIGVYLADSLITG